MIIRKQYNFPRPEVEGIEAVEKKYLELLHRLREFEKLDNEEIDYMDYANNVLMST